MFPQLFLGRHDLVRGAFVLRQVADQSEDSGDIARLRQANPKIGFCSLQYHRLVLLGRSFLRLPSREKAQFSKWPVEPSLEKASGMRDERESLYFFARRSCRNVRTAASSERRSPNDFASASSVRFFKPAIRLPSR